MMRIGELQKQRAVCHTSGQGSPSSRFLKIISSGPCIKTVPSRQRLETLKEFLWSVVLRERWTCMASHWKLKGLKAFSFKRMQPQQLANVSCPLASYATVIRMFGHRM
jgi:hypothetical protein